MSRSNDEQFRQGLDFYGAFAKSRFVQRCAKHPIRSTSSRKRTLAHFIGFIGVLVPASCSSLGDVGSPVAFFAPNPAIDGRTLVRMPAPAPQPRVVDAVAMNARCEACHADIATEWNSSLHRAAHTDPVYQRAFAIEPLAFCQGCHAPEADPKTPVPAALGALGVGCVTCHWTGHEVLAAPRSSGSGMTNASVEAHPILREPRFAGAPACASCHEFAFPDSARRLKPELMQSTISEHAAAESDRSCADCHMPPVLDKTSGKNHRSHVFEASRNPEMVRRAVTISAERSGPGTVRFTLTPTWAGHAFPTGDLFRRVEVHVDAVGAEYQAVASSTRYLMRHFAERKHGAGLVRYVESDDRPLGTPLTVDMNLGPAASDLPMAYRLAYQRVEHPRSEKPEDSVVEGEVVLSEGILPPLGKKP
jgi:Cytochrome c554 and c-prime